MHGIAMKNTLSVFVWNGLSSICFWRNVICMYLTNRSKIWISLQYFILQFNAISPSLTAHKSAAIVGFLKTTAAVNLACFLTRILWEICVSFFGRESIWTWKIQQGRRHHTFTWRWKQSYLLRYFFKLKWKREKFLIIIYSWRILCLLERASSW